MKPMLTRLAVWLSISAVALLSADSERVTIQLSEEIAPPGGSVQIKAILRVPKRVASGRLVLRLNPAVFETIGYAAVFSAKGDAFGVAKVTGLTFDVKFSSSTGSLGQLVDQPILVVNATLKPDAAIGLTIPIGADASQSMWFDWQGHPLAVEVLPGKLTVDGTVSIASVSPGGGLLPAGTLVRIGGTGFTQSTGVEIAGVSLSSVDYVTSEEITVTLAAPAELTGKAVLLREENSVVAVYHSFLQPTGSGSAPSDFSHLLFAAETWPGRSCVTMGSSGLNYVAIENPNLNPVDVKIQSGLSTLGPEQIVSIAPGGRYVTQVSIASYVDLVPTAPIRAFKFQVLITGDRAIGAVGASCRPLEPVRVAPPPTASPAVLDWQWQSGSAPPPPREIKLSSAVRSFSVAGGSWLTVTPKPDCPGEPLCSWSTASVSVHPEGLATGTYRAEITMSSDSGQLVRIPVSLMVTPSPVPLFSATPARLQFRWTYPGPAPPPQTIQVSATSGAGAFRVRVDELFPFSRPVFLVSPSSGDGPVALTVSMDASQLGLSDHFGTITITGPQNTIVIPVSVIVSGIQAIPAALTFSARAGSNFAQTLKVDVDTPSSSFDGPHFTFVAAVTPSVRWLSVTTSPPNSKREAYVTVNAAGLPAGSYSGTITLSIPGGGPQALIAVSLVVWSTPPPLTVTPSSLTFVTSVGGIRPPAQKLSVTSGGIPLPLQWKFGLVGVSSPFDIPALSPGEVALMVGEQSTLGEFRDVIEITAPSGKVVIPVTVGVTPSINAPPRIGSIVNAASQRQGAIAPGELVTIHGFGVGAGGEADRNTQVLFDGRPAAIVHQSPYQTTVIAPSEIAPQPFTEVQIVRGDLTSGTWGAAVAGAAPGIFSQDGSGVGNAALLNEDGSANHPNNPVARGSRIVVYATGQGLIGATVPVGVSLAGIAAAVEEMTVADGVLRLIVRVPPETIPGPGVPIQILIGGLSSQGGVTVAVE